MRENERKVINQILVTDKVIVTPDFKTKRKVYKFNFFLSVFLACVLFSCCIYAEYDRNRSEEVSQDILVGLQDNIDDTTTISVEEDVIIVNALADREEDTQTEVDVSSVTPNNSSGIPVEAVAADGTSYYTESVLNIPSLGIEYPVLSDWSDELLKISLNKLHGPKPNEVGNYVIIGHNYKNGKMFGKLPSISEGDTFTITDLSGKVVTYSVYKRYVVEPTDVSCTSQRTDGKREVTLITCTNGGKQRLVVKGREIL